ncbi:MAG TPA: dienelactone hydrolase family protein [Burkholderiales bacterium]|nr:dienelactone hydrolase family protein [Burkholderiales bacterium]
MSVPVTVSKPDGAGPFPAIVLMHDCSGLGPRSSGTPGLWARTLVERGYVVIMPDSFSTRGFPDGVCIHAPRGRQNVSPSRRVEDAFEALAYAQKLPYVDGGRVGIMGGSHGGSTTLLALGQGSGGFRAGVALYPRCSFAAQSYAPSAPLMILTGELDDWTPAAECRRLEGGPTLLKIYPGAHHSFDNERPVRFVPERINPSSPSGRGATTGGNAAAWRDAIEQVTAFFARM